MLALLSQRNFCLLWIAHTFSILGDYVFFIAITFWIYSRTGSAAATGAVLIASAIPALFFTPLAGWCTDRWSRRAIMLVAESARALLFLALLAVFSAQPSAIWPIYVASFVQSALAAFFWTARSALLPQLVAAPALLAANALYLVSDSGIRLIAPALSTFLLLSVGVPGIIAGDAATFVISAGSICLLALPPLLSRHTIVSRANKASSASFSTFFTWNMGAPGRRKWRTHPYLTTLSQVSGILVTGAIVSFTAGTLSILFPAFVRASFSAGAAAYGWILTAQALGEGATSLLFGQSKKPQRNRHVLLLISGSLVAGGCALLLMDHWRALVPCLLLNLVFGATTAAISVPALAFLQQHTPERFSGRVLATWITLQAYARVAGMSIAGMASAPVGVSWFFVLNGVLYLLGSVLLWITRKSRI